MYFRKFLVVFLEIDIYLRTSFVPYVRRTCTNKRTEVLSYESTKVHLYNALSPPTTLYSVLYEGTKVLSKVLSKVFSYFRTFVRKYN